MYSIYIHTRYLIALSGINEISSVNDLNYIEAASEAYQPTDDPCQIAMKKIIEIMWGILFIVFAFNLYEVIMILRSQESIYDANFYSDEMYYVFDIIISIMEILMVLLVVYGLETNSKSICILGVL